jgi:hypothetical protein
MSLETQQTGWLLCLSLDATAASWEAMADRAARYGWAELDALDEAVQPLHCARRETLEEGL